MAPRGLFTETGYSGLDQTRGIIQEEWLSDLSGARGMRVYREMSDNDAVLGAMLHAIVQQLRGVTWTVEARGETEEDLAAAAFVESCMEDMSMSWGDFISEALTKLVFGWSYFEVVYKRRDGSQGINAKKASSNFDDGRIGWRKFAGRAQDTLRYWDIDDSGGIQGMVQSDQQGANRYIPISRSMLFRTSRAKNNPEGRSILRNAYTSWYYRRRIMEYEAIGVERDFAGLPVFYAPEEIFDSAASSTEKAALSEYKKIASELKRNERASLVLPSVFDEKGNRLVDIKLLSSGGSRQLNTNEIVDRHTKEMAMTTLSDVILLGHENVGSLALGTVKQSMWLASLTAQVMEISDVLNRHEIPRLMKLNGWQLDEYPIMVAGSLQRPDTEELAMALERLVNAGMLSPDEEDERFLRSLLGLPQPENLDMPEAEAAAPEPMMNPEEV